MAIDDFRALISNATEIKKYLLTQRQRSISVRDLKNSPFIVRQMATNQIRESQVKKAIGIVLGKPKARRGASLVDPSQVMLIEDLLRYDAYVNHQRQHNVTIPHRLVEQRLLLTHKYRTLFERNCTKTHTLPVSTFVALIDFKTASALLPYYQALVGAIAKRRLAVQRGSTVGLKEMSLEEFLFLRFLVEDDVFAVRPLYKTSDAVSAYCFNGRLFGCYSYHDALRDKLLSVDDLESIVKSVMGKNHTPHKGKMVLSKKQQKIICELILVAIANNSAFRRPPAL